MTARGSWLLRMLGYLPKPEKRAPADDEPPTQVTRDRIGDYLLSKGYRFIVDDDGDLTGTWDGSRFWFLLLGENDEIVQVRGRWQRQLPLDQRPAVSLALNDWNRDRIWPKAYVREEEGLLALYSEVSADFEPGATEDQLAQILACGLGTGVQLFAALEATLPDDGAARDTPDR